MNGITVWQRRDRSVTYTASRPAAFTAWVGGTAILFAPDFATAVQAASTWRRGDEAHPAPAQMPVQDTEV
jgi:hypothetical protein